MVDPHQDVVINKEFDESSDGLCLAEHTFNIKESVKVRGRVRRTRGVLGTKNFTNIGSGIPKPSVTTMTSNESNFIRDFEDGSGRLNTELIDQIFSDPKL